MINNKYRVIPKPGVSRVNRKVVSPQIISRKISYSPPRSKVKIQSRPKVHQVVNKKIERVVQNRHIHGELLRKKITKKQPSIFKRRIDKKLDSYNDKINEIRNCGEGRILVITACGPTINEIEINRLKNLEYVDLLTINKPNINIFPTKYWVFCDKSQYNRNKEEFDGYKGLLLNPYSIRTTKPNQIMFRTRAGKGFSKDLLSGIHVGRSTTYTSMQLAHFMNYDKVYILGCDMSFPENGPTHAYGENPDVNRETRKKRFAKEAENYQYGASQMTPAERSRFVFCSNKNKWPFTRFFENLDQKDVVDKVLSLNQSYLKGH